MAKTSVKADSKDKSVFVSSLRLKGFIMGKTMAEEVLPIPRPTSKAVGSVKKGDKIKTVKAEINKKDNRERDNAGRLDFKREVAFKFSPPSYKIMISVTVAARTVPTCPKCW